MYRIEIDRQASKFLEKLRESNLRIRLIQAIDSLSTQPLPMGSQKLSGRENQYRVRVGDYRIIYQIDHGRVLILVLEIGHRREIYR
jgi:mRNA interferase RelE/StbE